MANRATIAAGDLASATVFGTVTNTPDIHGSTNISVNATNRFTAGFTAPSILIDACHGVWFWVTTLGVTTSWTVTLQEATVDTAATVTVTGSDIKLGWNFFEFPTPYVFTSLTANTYRFKFSAVVSTNATIAANAAGSTAAFLAVDSRTGAVGATDDCWVAHAMTYAGTTMSFGSQTEATLGGLATTRNVGGALTIGRLGSITVSRAGNTNLTTKGYVFVDGVYDRGTDASPIPDGITCTHTFSMASTNTMGFVIGNSGTYDAVGAAKAYYRSRVVSGNGSTATPLTLTDPVDWAVGDEICLEAVGGLTETEYKFIRTKVSATEYTLADTAGGAESALTNSHNGGWCLNLQRNVIVTSDNAARGFNFTTIAVPAGTTGCRMKWFRHSPTGSTSSTGCLRVQLAGASATIDYGVLSNIGRRGWFFTTTKAFNTFTGNILCRGNTNVTNASSTGIIGFSSSNNKTFVGCHVVDTQNVGVEFITSFNHRFEDCHFTANNKNSLAIPAGITLTTSGLVTFDGCSLNGSGTKGISGVGATDIVFSECDLGTTITNTIEIELTVDTYNTFLFNRCNLGSVTRVSQNTIALPGTLLRFHAMNEVDNDHTWYTINGQGRSTGAGLSDTTIRTASSLAVRLAPETEDGIVHRYKILARPDTAVSALGFVRMNAAYAGDANTVLTVSLFLPGSAEADATTTITKTADTWQVYNLAANYSGSVTSYATVEVKATNIDAVANAYVYHDDIFNGTNAITAVDVWDEGQPSEIMFEQLGDAAAVWAVATSTLTTAGTTGKQLKDALTTTKFLGLK